MLVPARYGSKRFPGKPLAPLTGRHGEQRPLLERTWRAASADGFLAVHVLTDDRRVADCAAGFGAEVLMTPVSCRNGTERCAAALPHLPKDIEIVVNVQGDSPLTPPGVASHLAAHLAAFPDADVATPVFAAPRAVRERMVADAEAGRVGGTSAVFDHAGRALYFSKRLLPYGVENDPGLPLFLHLGIYAYRREALAKYPQLPVSRLEMTEGLEQLRFLDAGMRIDTVEIEPLDDFWEVNNPEDVPIVERALAARGIA